MDKVYPSYAKLNLFLYIIQKRQDGLHDLESLFIPIKLSDSIHFEPIAQSYNEVKVKFNHLQIDSKNNTIQKTIALLINQYRSNIKKPSLSIEVDKKIPMQAGLGGGSSNAAVCLKYLNEFWNLNLSQNELMNIAQKVGSDVPFFLINQPCFVQGKGEQLSAISNFPKLYVSLFTPQAIECNTQELFSHPLVIKNSDKKLAQLKALSTQELIKELNSLKNCFHSAIIEKYPHYLTYINRINKVTGNYNLVVKPRFTGTGSTFFWASYQKNDLVEINKILIESLTFKQNELILTQSVMV